MEVILSNIQSQSIATILRNSLYTAVVVHCVIAVAMTHLNELSSNSPAQDVSQARSDGKVHLLLAASGSVATIKIPNIIKGLSQHPNLSIRLVLTSSAAHFLQGQAGEQPSLSEIRKYPNVDAIYTDESEWVQQWTRGAPILHIELRKCK
jgi:phosphopantothenoylcysteine decarboxylase